MLAVCVIMAYAIKNLLFFINASMSCVSVAHICGTHLRDASREFFC